MQGFQLSSQKSFHGQLILSVDLIGYGSLPISSYVTIPLRIFSIMLLLALMTQLCVTRNMLEKAKDVLSRDLSHDLKWVHTNLSQIFLFKLGIKKAVVE